MNSTLKTFKVRALKRADVATAYDALADEFQTSTPHADLIENRDTVVPDRTDISPELKADLETRLQAFHANPEAGYSWDEVKAKIKDGTWPGA